MFKQKLPRKLKVRILKSKKNINKNIKNFF